MNRTDIAQLDEDQIVRVLNSWDLNDQWMTLVQLAGDEAATIVKLVCNVLPSNCAESLQRLEADQAERGASFLGMLPDQIPGDLDSPTDLAASLNLATQLAQIRAANLQAVAETMPQYLLSFAGGEPDLKRSTAAPADWALDIDVSGIRAVLDYFDSDNPTEDTASQIASMPAFTEMMRHRRELGYGPEPLIDETGLAWCLVHAASHEPLDMMWKWLHPQNLFDLSDMFTHRAQYRNLIDQLIKDNQLADYILGRIAEFAPIGTLFSDRLSFAVGWAIRGWATNESGGLNIEHVKDVFSDMLPTLVHETFHRLQTQISLADPTIAGVGFDRITSHPFDDIADAQLYQALCYIMLEGSATYVASDCHSQAWGDAAEAGVALLSRIIELDSPQEQDERFDELLTEGLRSNGPFYGFGALLSSAIVEKNTPSKLGEWLGKGAPAFFEQAFLNLNDSSLALALKLAARVQQLCTAIANA